MLMLVKKLRIEMTPKQVNKAFSAKSTQIMRLERHKAVFYLEREGEPWDSPPP